MKYLVLTGKFGMGHVVTAAAIKQELEKNSDENEVQVVDLIEEFLPRSSKVIYRIYDAIMRKCIRIYNLVYLSSDKLNDVGMPVKKLVLKKVKKLLAQYQPDKIISTQPLCSKMISIYKEKTDCSIPLATCITDVHTHPQWLCKSTDAYFVPTMQTKEEMVARGIAKEKVYPVGLTVREQFKDRTIKREGNKGKKHVLVMGGGIGMLPKKHQLLKELDAMEDVVVTVITGKNERMYNQLKNKYSKMDVIYYTDKVEAYMETADLIVTKPGGITLFEAMHMGVPLFVAAPFMGQEIFNANYIEEKNIGMVVRKGARDYKVKLEECLGQNERLDQMSSNMTAICRETPEYQISQVIEDIKGSGKSQCS